MQPGDVKREIERLVDETNAVRERLAALGAKLAAACELLATMRSSAIVRENERTPAEESAQEAAPGHDEAHTG